MQEANNSHSSHRKFISHSLQALLGYKGEKSNIEGKVAIFF